MENVHPNFVKVLNCQLLTDTEWTENLSKLPCFTFRTLYKHFAERAEKEVDEGITSERADAESSLGEQAEDMGSSNVDDDTPPTPKFRSFRGLDKGYRFFRDGHVQRIRLHPLPQSDGLCYIHSRVLPSMRKDRIYDVRICCSDLSDKNVPTDIHAVYCVCPAGLAGS